MRAPAIFAIVILLSACKAGLQLPHNAVALGPEQARAALDQCSRPVPEGVTGSWALTQDVATALEQDLPKLSGIASDRCCITGGTIVAPGSYHRQYSGIFIHGKKYVYINAFKLPTDSLPWRTEPVVQCDGGEIFWGALYDPATRQFSQLAFNGRI